MNSLLPSPGSRVLVVDDHRQIREPLALYLRKHGFDVRTADSANAMWHLLDQQRFNVVLLDVMLPDGDGFDLCSRIQSRSDVPVILLTARDTQADKIRGLDLGADDYITKPFEPRELIARINSLLRRASRGAPTQPLSPSTELITRQYQFAGLLFSGGAGCLVNADGANFQLSTAEARLLQVFLEHPNEILDRERLIALIADAGSDIYDRSVDRQVSRLRQKLADIAQSGNLLRTVRGAGYMFVTQVHLASAC